MKFIKRKNLYEGEDLLYIPELHWMYIVRPLINALIIFATLAVLYYCIGFGASLLGQKITSIAQAVIKYLSLAAILYVLALFGMQISLCMSTEYGITSKRLLMKKGFFRITVKDIPIDRIESILCHQGILGRIFHYGTIYISGIGGTTPVFFMVCKPYAVRRKIISVVEKNKAVTVIHGEPPMPPAPPPTLEPAEEAEPTYRYGTFVRVLDGRE
jgi:uncharacterized membrane protein YdbT with pleckstrin-like domain